MKESPPIKVTGHDLGTFEGSPLAYVAALFKGTLPSYPAAVLLIAGSSSVAGRAHDRLTNALGVPAYKIQQIPIADRQFQDSVNIVISYFPDPLASGKQKLPVEFKVEWEKVTVEFEVSPDGAYVEEIKAQWAPLKLLIKKHALSGITQNLKVGTKIESLISFDRETSVKIETSIKNKLKLALSADVLFPGTKKTINVEFYGAGGFKLKDGSIKPVFEGGVMLTVPFDLF